MKIKTEEDAIVIITRIRSMIKYATESSCPSKLRCLTPIETGKTSYTRMNLIDALLKIRISKSSIS